MTDDDGPLTTAEKQAIELFASQAAQPRYYPTARTSPSAWQADVHRRLSLLEQQVEALSAKVEALAARPTVRRRHWYQRLTTIEETWSDDRDA